MSAASSRYRRSASMADTDIDLDNRPVLHQRPEPVRGGAEVSAIGELCHIGRLFYQRGWSVGTSSNYSVVLGRHPLRLLITASGKDKSALSESDFVIVDEEG